MSPLLLHIFPTFVAAGPQVRTTQLINAIGPDFEALLPTADNKSEWRVRIDDRGL